MLHHTAAVARGVQRALIVADLPFASYDTPEQAVANARRLIAAGAHAVKLEGGVSHAARIAALVAEKIPVMAHLGMLPQSIREEGGYKLKGKTPESAAALLADAFAVESAGAFAVVIELVKADVAARISAALTIPAIGIGSGAGCDGQVLVTHDLIGLFPWFTPKFARQHAHVAASIREAATTFRRETKSGQ